MPDKPKPSAIFVMGPTASGKTELAIQLVKQFSSEIISVDSALVYRDMNIGTAKPSADELANAPHQLIDICDPDDSYSAARFRKDALQAMKEITQRGHTPLLVGGTMLYFRALQQGLSPLPEADESIRTDLLNEAAKIGWQGMHDELAGIDPVAAERIHPNDPQRIQRALEVYRITGMPMTQVQQVKGNALPYNVLKFIWAPFNREILRQRIAMRFRQMLEKGFEQEVRQLLERYHLTEQMPSMRSVGYRQMFEYINGRIDYETMVQKGITATRQLAKRQMTWLRKEQGAIWVNSQEQLKEHLTGIMVN